MRRGVLTAAVALCIASVSGPTGAARAQSAHRAEARALFDAAVVEMQRGRYGTACERLHRARDLVSAANVHWNLALCERARWGLLAARRELVAFVRVAGDDPRVSTAQAAIGELDARIPYVELVLPRIEGAWLAIDGDVIHDLPPEMSHRVDPGVTEIRVGAPGHEVWRDEVLLEEGESRWIVVELEPGRLGPSSEWPSRTGASQSPELLPSTVASASGHAPAEDGASSWPWIAGITGALGVAVAIAVVLLSSGGPEPGTVGGVIRTLEGP